jgi:class 3 adenylate cyclase
MPNALHLAQSQQPMPSAGAQIGFVVFGILVGLTVMAVTILFLRRRRARVGGESACGKCGYLVKGLTTFTCPECGSDLREVGILRGRQAHTRSRKPRWPLLRASALPVAIWLVGCLIFIAIASFVIRQYLWPNLSVTTHKIDAYPKSRRFTAIRFYTKTEAAAFGRTGAAKAPPRVRYGRIEIQDGSREYLLGIDYLRNTHHYSDASGLNVPLPGPPTAASVLNFLKSNHIDTNDAGVQAEAAAAATLMTDAARSPNLDLKAPANFPFDVTFGGGFGSLVEQPSFDDVQNVVWPLLLLIGVVVIVWRRRKRLRAAGVIGVASAPPIDQPPPTSSSPARTLSILFSDIKDFTTRTASGTRNAAIDLVRRHRDLVTPIVKTHHGRIVKSIGDALLATFDSATDAVLAAGQIQSRLREQNAAAFDEATRFELRIAVSTGEVVVESDDVFGEAVNLASRVQQLASAGEVLFTETTCAMVNKREVAFEDAGTFELKGVPEAVKVYRVITANQPLNVAVDAEGKP